MNANAQDLCVVVSHYNLRPDDELVRLLRQLHTQVERCQSYFSTKIVVVVNMGESRSIPLPADLADITIQYRENTGFNIGSWDYGWRHNPDFYGYLFLQDECEVAHPDALLHYWWLLKNHPDSLIGESLFFYRGWKGFLNRWPINHTSIENFASQKHISLGLTASHLQTLILASTDQTLAKLDGFILSNDKIEAIATEVLLSRKAASAHIAVEQSAWKPFTYFTHDQWASVRQTSQSVRWSLSKLIWYVLYGWRDLSIRLTP